MGFGLSVTACAKPWATLRKLVYSLAKIFWVCFGVSGHTASDKEEIEGHRICSAVQFGWGSTKIYPALLPRRVENFVPRAEGKKNTILLLSTLTCEEMWHRGRVTVFVEWMMNVLSGVKRCDKGVMGTKTWLRWVRGRTKRMMGREQGRWRCWRVLLGKG